MPKYPKFPAWARFWDLERQLRLYFTQITGESSYALYKHFIIFLLPLSFIFISFLTKFPLTPFQRLLLSDPCLFFGLSPTFNWIFLILGGDNLAFHIRMYRPASEVFWVIREILFEKIQRKKNGKGQSSIEIVKKYVAKYLSAVKYFIFVEILVLLFLKCSSIYRIALDWRFFFTTISGFASLSVIFTSSLFFDIFSITYGNSHIILSTGFIAFTLITYLQLGKANSLLEKTPLTSARLRRFTSVHTGMLGLIFQITAFYGQLLTVFIALQLPCNSYLLICLLLGHFNGVTAIIFLNIICIQFLTLFFFHALSASFSSRIHACKRRLFAQQRANLPLADKLKMDSYLMKFNVRKKYGITYGSIGLVTFSSFSKFLIIYSEIIMFWFKLVAIN